jgi:hypothetical protein
VKRGSGSRILYENREWNWRRVVTVGYRCGKFCFDMEFGSGSGKWKQELVN